MLTENMIAKAKPKEKLYRISDGLKNGLSIEISRGRQALEVPVSLQGRG